MHENMMDTLSDFLQIGWMGAGLACNSKTDVGFVPKCSVKDVFLIILIFKIMYRSLGWIGSDLVQWIHVGTIW